MHIVKLNEPQKEMFILSAAFMLFVAVGILLFLKPSWEDLEKKRDAVQESEVRNQVAESMEKIKMKMSQLGKKILEESKQYGVIDDLTALAGRHRLSLEALTPKTAASGAGYKTLVVDFSGFGEFKDILQVVRGISIYPNPLSVTRIDLSRFKRDSRVPDKNLKYQITIQTLLREGSG